MPRVTGIHRQQTVGGEAARAFIPHPLPPEQPPLLIEDELSERHLAATIAIERLSVAAVTVPSLPWFLYGFVRKEAVISSQIEGTQATLEDVVQFEATRTSDRPDDVEEICNYVAALEYAHREVLQTTKPTAAKAIEALSDAGIVVERTGRQRDRVYGYQRYLKLLSADTQLPKQ